MEFDVDSLMTTKALTDLLVLALMPCENFSSVCKNFCIWNPTVGHIPRGFIGATKQISDVKLILVTAEPGDPGDNEIYSGTAENMLEEHIKFAHAAFNEGNLRRNGRAAPYRINLQKILDLCWPNKTREEQLQLTWITNTVKCSAQVSGGQIPSEIEHTCIEKYLKQEISLLEKAFIVALGGKAALRMKRCGIMVDSVAQHPSARPNTDPLSSWQISAAAFHNWIALNA